jgi:hypothetical protein
VLRSHNPHALGTRPLRPLRNPDAALDQRPNVFNLQRIFWCNQQTLLAAGKCNDDRVM